MAVTPAPTGPTLDGNGVGRLGGKHVDRGQRHSLHRGIIGYASGHEGARWVPQLDSDRTDDRRIHPFIVG